MSLLKDKYFWVLLLVSLSARIYLSIFTYVIQNDSAAFIQNAEYFTNGDFIRGLGHPYHPLYSLIIAGLYKVVPNLELSGIITSIFFSTFTVIGFYLIGKRVFDQKISFLSSVILALHPYAVRFSADIISESTYFFFFISAMGLGYFVIINRNYLLCVLTGICAAFAYLTRPEGIGIILIIVCWCIFKDFFKIKILWREKLISIIIIVFSFLAISSPYLIYIKKETGAWRLTKKKKISMMFGVGKILNDQNNKFVQNQETSLPPPVPSVQTPVQPIKPHPDAQSSPDIKLDIDTPKQIAAIKINLRTHLKSVLYIVEKYLSTFHPFLFIFFIIGVINWTRIRKEKYFGFYTATIIVFYLLILYRLNITNISNYGSIFQYPSRRHLMPIIIPAVFFTGVGAYAVGTWLYKKTQFGGLRNVLGKLSKSEWVICLMILAVIICILLPKTLKPQRADKLGIKSVGKWIKENSDKPSPSILSSSARNAYYAGGRHIQMGNINNAFSIAISEKADYVLITNDEYKSIGKELLQFMEKNKVVPVYKYPDNTSLDDNTIFLYKTFY